MVRPPALLALHPQPLRGESLTSWLIRVAEANEIRIEQLLSAYVGKDLWHERDFDFFKPSELSKLAAMAAPKALPRLRTMSLARWANSLNLQIRPGVPYSHTWIASIKETRYCPECLKGDERRFLRRNWRLQCLSVCPIHRIFLRTGCQNPKCRYSQPMRLLHSNMACTRCGTLFANAGAYAAAGGALANNFSRSSSKMFNSNKPPRWLAIFETTSILMAVLLHIVRRLGTFIARNQAKGSLPVKVAKYSHNQAILNYWRSDERITYSLMNSALEIILEGPQDRILHLAKKHFSPAHQQAPPSWIRNGAQDAWNMIDELVSE